MEHRSSTNVRHLTLFSALSFASCHVSPLSSNSDIHVRLQVCRGLPLSRFPCRFHSRTLLAMHPSGLLTVWPIQSHARCLSPPLLSAALFASKAPHYGFFWATKSARCSLGSYWWTPASVPLSASKFPNHSRARPSDVTQRLSDLITIAGLRSRRLSSRGAHGAKIRKREIAYITAVIIIFIIFRRFYVTVPRCAPWIQFYVAHWFFSGAERFSRDVEDMIGHPISKWWLVCWKYLSPLMVLVSTVVSLVISTNIY